MLDKPTAGGGICARRRVYLTDRPEDMCRAGMAIQNANDTFQCTFRDEGRIARIFQIRGEFIGLWIGQTNGWSDYAVSFAEDDRGTVIALSWVETPAHPPLQERQLNEFMCMKLDARPL